VGIGQAGGGNGGAAYGSDLVESVATSAVANSGSGGGANGTWRNASGNGGSGVVILRYPTSQSIVIGAGLTATTSVVGVNNVTVITAGTGNVSWS
jgi:hypothetical protein